MQDSPYEQRPWLKQYDYWIPKDINFPRQSINQILDLAALYFRDRPATAFLGAQLTFAEIKRQAMCLAAALASLGIKKGDCVGVMLPNCPQYLISFFAITRLGAIVTNVNPIYTAREVELVAKDSGMRVLITLDLLTEVAQSVQRQTSIAQIISTSAQEYSAQPPTEATIPAGTP